MASTGLMLVGPSSKFLYMKDLLPFPIYEFKFEEKKIVVAESLDPAPLPLFTSFIANTPGSGDVFFHIDQRVGIQDSPLFYVLESGSRIWKPLISPPSIENVKLSMVVLHNNVFVSSFVGDPYLARFDPIDKSWKVEPAAKNNLSNFIRDWFIESDESADFRMIHYPLISVTIPGLGSSNYTVCMMHEELQVPPKNPEVNVFAVLVNHRNGRVAFYQRLYMCFEGIQHVMDDGPRFNVVDLGNGKLCATLCGQQLDSTSSALCISIFTLSVAKDFADFAEQTGCVQFKLDNLGQVVIVYESHYLKNALAKRTTATLPVIKKAQYAILLSGTPALSRPLELFKQLEALYPDVFLDLSDKDMKQINALFRELEMLKAKIKAAKSKDEAESLKFSQKNLINKIYTDSAEAKIPAVLEYLGTVIEAGCKFLIFAHHQPMLDAIHEFVLKKKSGLHQEFRIDGGTAAASRQHLVTDFQEKDFIKAAVLSIKAGGVGLTLTAASTVIFAELSWTPGDLIQAEDRAHRIGQVSSVNIYYLLANDTVDDIIWDVVQFKLDNLGQMLDGHENTLAMSNNQPLNSPAKHNTIEHNPSKQKTLDQFIRRCDKVDRSEHQPDLKRPRQS
ncbi:hypothetical protein PIB30_096802 [Stylosanthes scabra]|uniref:Helicase C-terminal domain-containing protein n=1 Tax=Stylosanthes scabra TaxID=79078 RepID=A0ABU6SXC4_9FABA|nr:hypothetical protein [Stylosanthes scabra]